jgi:hypothetical protein
MSPMKEAEAIRDAQDVKRMDHQHAILRVSINVWPPTADG